MKLVFIPGIKDYSLFISLHAALNFWEAIGSDVIRARIYHLMCQAINVLTAKWKSYTLAPSHLHGKQNSKLRQRGAIQFLSAERSK